MSKADALIVIDCTAHPSYGRLVPVAAPNRNERRKIETRRRLIAAGQAIFAEKGIDAATIQDIADAADVGRGSFYNFFDTKEALVAAVVGELDDLIVDRGMQRIDQSTAPTDAVAIVLLYALEDLLAHPPAAWFVVRRRPTDGVRFRRCNDLITDLLDEGRAAGEFTLRSSEIGATIVAGTMRSGIEALLTGRATDAAAVVELTLRFFGVPGDRAAAAVRSAALPAR